MRSLFFVVAIAIAMMLLISVHRAEAEEVCDDDIEALATLCKEFVLKPGPPIDPSVQCCHAVEHANIPCVCAHIPKGLENIISMDKVAYVAKYCGQPLKFGSKCGNYTVPPV